VPLRPVVLRQVLPQSDALYGDRAGWIRSEALMKLDFGKGRLPGMLVLRAEDPHQFKPTHGTDLLAFFRRRVRADHAPLAVMTSRAGDLARGPRAALPRWLAHLRALDGAAANTLAAYGRDVGQFLAFLSHHRGGTEGAGRADRLASLISGLDGA
jgi:hypothetical protein